MMKRLQALSNWFIVCGFLVSLVSPLQAAPRVSPRRLSPAGRKERDARRAYRRQPRRTPRSLRQLAEPSALGLSEIDAGYGSLSLDWFEQAGVPVQSETHGVGKQLPQEILTSDGDALESGMVDGDEWFQFGPTGSPLRKKSKSVEQELAQETVTHDGRTFSGAWIMRMIDGLNNPSSRSGVVRFLKLGRKPKPFEQLAISKWIDGKQLTEQEDILWSDYRARAIFDLITTAFIGAFIGYLIRGAIRDRKQDYGDL